MKFPQIIEDEGLKELLERIPQTFTKMLDFINTQLDYAEAGQIIGELESVSMDRIINAVIENFEYAEQEGIAFSASCRTCGSKVRSNSDAESLAKYDCQFDKISWYKKSRQDKIRW